MISSTDHICIIHISRDAAHSWLTLLSNVSKRSRRLTGDQDWPKDRESLILRTVWPLWLNRCQAASTTFRRNDACHQPVSGDLGFDLFFDELRRVRDVDVYQTKWFCSCLNRTDVRLFSATSPLCDLGRWHRCKNHAWRSRRLFLLFTAVSLNVKRANGRFIYTQTPPVTPVLLRGESCRRKFSNSAPSQTVGGILVIWFHITRHQQHHVPASPTQASLPAKGLLIEESKTISILFPPWVCTSVLDVGFKTK